MLRQALIVAVIILSLGIMGVIGYTYGTSGTPSATIPATPNSQKPIQQGSGVYEKKIPYTVTLPSYNSSEEADILKFQAEAGNRVEGEVDVGKYYLNIPGQIEGNPYN